MSGFKVEMFVDLSEQMAQHLTCGICRDIFNNAVISANCGHNYCKDCIEDCIIKSVDNKDKCPVCRKGFTRKRRSDSGEEINTIVIRNFVFNLNLMANNMINDLEVDCDFRSNGCEETPKLGALQSHLKVCEYWTCETCGHSDKINGSHDCIDSLKNVETEFKQEVNKLKLKINRLEENLSKSKDENHEMALQLSLKDDQIDDLNEEIDKLNEQIENRVNSSSNKTDSQSKRKRRQRNLKFDDSDCLSDSDTNSDDGVSDANSSPEESGIKYDSSSSEVSETEDLLQN